MKKTQILILISIVTLTLVGLILIQAYWIRQSVKVSQHYFDHRVYQSMKKIVKNLQDQETIYYVTKEINSSDLDSINVIQPTVIKDSIKSFLQQTNNLANLNLKYELINPDSIVITNDKRLDIKDNVVTRQNLQERYISKVHDKVVFIEKVIDKLISHNPKIEERIDTGKFKQELAKELRCKAIDLPFEFCIKEKEQNGKTVLKSTGYSDSYEDKIYTTDLFPEDIIVKPYSLELYFPSQTNYVFRSLGIMAITSALLTGIIIVIFSITIWIILRQKKVSEIKNDFINNMTHELKTPISTISLASQMLNDTSIPAESKNVGNLSKIIQDETKRLSFQVEKVLQMAVFDKTQIKLKLKSVDIHILLQNITRNFQLQVSQRNGKIELDLKAQDFVISGDEMHLSNLFINLIDNALKYTVQDPLILITTRSIRTGMYIFVQDNGIGISKENQKKIFEKFYRVPTGNIHNVKGFGLGLSYVRKIVEEHKGSIFVESEDKTGSTFKIFLPKDLKTTLI